MERRPNMKIIYFPGYGGGENSTTYQTILERYPDSTAIIYDNVDAAKAFAQIQEQLAKLDLREHLIVGQSLGGFWAEHFAHKLDQRVLLINPSLDPFHSLRKHGHTAEDLTAYATRSLPGRIDKEVSIILSKEDTVVSPEPVLAKYHDKATIRYVDGGHRFREYAVLFDAIEALMGRAKVN